MTGADDNPNWIADTTQPGARPVEETMSEAEKVAALAKKIRYKCYRHENAREPGFRDARYSSFNESVCAEILQHQLELAELRGRLAQHRIDCPHCRIADAPIQIQRRHWCDAGTKLVADLEAKIAAKEKEATDAKGK